MTPCHRSFAILIACCALVATVLTLVATRHGMALSPDSPNYFAASESLLAGRGFLGLDGRPMILWPVGYSLALGALQVVGMHEMAAGRTIAVLSVGVLPVIVAVGVVGLGGSQRTAALAAMLLALSPALQHHAVFALSDAPYAAIAACGVVALLCGMHRRSPGLLMLSSAVLGVGAIVRYAGMPVIGAAAVLVCAFAWYTRSLRATTVVACLFLLFAPLGLHLARNAAVRKTVGERGHSTQRVTNVPEAVGRVTAAWLAPSVAARHEGMVGKCAMLTGLALAVFGVYRRDWRWVALALLAASFVAFHAIAGIWGGADFLTSRILLPLLPLCLVCVATGVDRLWRLLPVAGMAATALLLALSAAAVPEAVAAPNLTYNARVWHESRTMVWLLQHREGRPVVSNHPTGVWAAGGGEVYESPRAHEYQMPGTPTDDVAFLNEQLVKYGWLHLAWFEFARSRSHVLPFADVAKHFIVIPVQAFDDGAVYRLERRPVGAPDTPLAGRP